KLANNRMGGYKAHNSSSCVQAARCRAPAPEAFSGPEVAVCRSPARKYSRMLVSAVMAYEGEKPGPPGDGGGLAYTGYSKLVVHGLLPPLAGSGPIPGAWGGRLVRRETRCNLNF